MLPLSPATVKKVAIGAAALVVLIVSSITVGRWWSGQKAALTDQIAGLKAGIASRDVQIKARDAEIHVRDNVIAGMRHQDSARVDTITTKTEEAAAAKADLATAEHAIDADAETHAGLVPIAAVHEMELKGDVAVKSCEDLGTQKDQRIDGLLAQLANEAATRAQLESTRAALDTNATAQTTVLKDTVAVLKPPWFRRFLGWVDDHAVTLAVGAVGGFVIAKH